MTDLKPQACDRNGEVCENEIVTQTTTPDRNAEAKAIHAIYAPGINASPETKYLGTIKAMASVLDQRDAAIARAERAEALLAECAEYLKEGETPRERMDRDQKDVLALMELLRDEKVKTEALTAKLTEVEGRGFIGWALYGSYYTRAGA